MIPITIKMAYYFYLTRHISYHNLSSHQDKFWDMMRKYGKNWEGVRTNNWEDDTYTLDWNVK